MKVLITGVTGFLGSGLAENLSQRFDVIGVSGSSDKTVSNSSIKHYRSGDLESVTEKPEVVVMCHAAVSSGGFNADNQSLYNANVRFTEAITGKFPEAYHLYISTVSVYGDRKEVMDESSLPSPQTTYAVSKLWGEKIVGRTSNHGILRLSSLYGTGMNESTVLPMYVSQAIGTGVIKVWGDGSRKQNYIHRDDVIQYIANMIQEKSTGIYLGVSTTGTSNRELAGLVATMTGAEIKFEGNDESWTNKFDNAFTRGKLKLEGEIKLADGLEAFISWKKRQY